MQFLDMQSFPLSTSPDITWLHGNCTIPEGISHQIVLVSKKYKYFYSNLVKIIWSTKYGTVYDMQDSCPFFRAYQKPSCGFYFLWLVWVYYAHSVGWVRAEACLKKKHSPSLDPFTLVLLTISVRPVTTCFLLLLHLLKRINMERQTSRDNEFWIIFWWITGKKCTARPTLRRGHVYRQEVLTKCQVPAFKTSFT